MVQQSAAVAQSYQIAVFADARNSTVTSQTGMRVVVALLRCVPSRVLQR